MEALGIVERIQYRLSGGLGPATLVDTAFILLKTEPSQEREVYQTLSTIEAVVETHALYGEYDLLARVECANSKALTTLLMQQMRQIEGVRETETLIAVDY